MKSNTVLLFIIVGISIGWLWYTKYSREGFQTEPKKITSSLSSPEQVTPDTCILLKNLHEQVKSKYVIAEKDNNPYLKDLLSSSITEMEKNLAKLGCS